MAIGPEKFKTVFDATLQSFEAFIDEQISNCKMKPNDTCVYINGPKGMTDTHFLVLRQKYLDLGWPYVQFYGGVMPKLRFDLTLID